MEFETQVQQEIYQKIEPWMKELFGIFYKKREDAPYFGINIGSAFVHVSVMPWGSDNVTITSRAYVAFNAELSPELLLFLLKENDRMRFGAFGLDEDNDIFFEHTLPGLNFDMEMVKSSILAVGYAVDQYDDQIVSRWGGLPASEAREEA